MGLRSVTRTPSHPLPETPATGLTLEELFAGRNIDIPAAQARMSHLMAEEGLPYGERTMTYNSRLAQELAKWAETQAGGQQIHDALFHAYFVDNMNLAKIENVIAIAERVGLSEAVTLISVLHNLANFKSPVRPRPKDHHAKPGMKLKEPK